MNRQLYTESFASWQPFNNYEYSIRRTVVAFEEDFKTLRRIRVDVVLNLFCQFKVTHLYSHFQTIAK